MEERSLDSVASNDGSMMSLHSIDSSLSAHALDKDMLAGTQNPAEKDKTDDTTDHKNSDSRNHKKIISFSGALKIAHDDDDLKELDSNLLSAQITKVVSTIEAPGLEVIKPVDSIPHSENLVDLTTDANNTQSENEMGLVKEEVCDSADQPNPEDSEECRNTEALESESTKKPMDINDVYSEVQIKVIDVPEDDDLFDFLRDRRTPQYLDESSNHSTGSNKQTVEDIQKKELYRYLTVSDPTLVRSQEVTPCQSGEESDSESHTDRSGSTEDLSSESDDVEQNDQLHPEGESRPETPVLEETPVKSRRKPKPKPKVDTPPAKPKKTPGQLSEKTVEKLEKCREATNKWLQDLKVPDELKFEKPLTLNITDLNQYLTCGLCKGYLYEASTITECMHTFCKNCIVRHCMEVSLHCPVCNILIHPTDPFVHIRLDRMLQDIVYKILPSVADNEFKNMQEFYEAHPEVEPKDIPDPPAEPKESPKEKEITIPRQETKLVSLLLEADGENVKEESIESLKKKFVQVPGAATVKSVCSFLRKKLNIDDCRQVDLYCCGDAMEQDDFTLENIQHKFYADEDCLMLLQYRVRDV